MLRSTPFALAVGAVLAGLTLSTASPAVAAAAATVALETQGELGTVRFAAPPGPPRGLVLLYSDAAGWNGELEATALRLADAGIAVAGVDLPTHLRALTKSDSKDCLYLVSAIEALSKRIQRDLGATIYRSPIVAGLGAGGTLAYAALAQAPAATVAGAVSLDAAPSLATHLPLCKGAPYERLQSGGYAYGRRDALPGWWRAAVRSGADALPFVAEVPSGERVTTAVDADLTDAMTALIEPPVALAEAAASDDLADLPIVPMPPETASTGLLAIILSGDGGWRDIDKQLGRWLVANGVGVVGVDSLRYFWTEKRPERIATDLTRIADRYLPEFGATRTILVGFSFGADVLPAAWRALPPRERNRAVQVSLLALSQAATFEFHVGSWLGLSRGDRTIAEDAPALDLAKVQCFFGEKEPETFCRDPLFRSVETIRTAGGHHFDGDYPALARRILEGAQRRLRTPP